MIAFDYNLHRRGASGAIYVASLLSLSLIAGCASGVDSTAMSPQDEPENMRHDSVPSGPLDESRDLDEERTSNCSPEDQARYENAILGANCPGPCCEEHAGLMDVAGSPLDHLMAPTIHSVY